MLFRLAPALLYIFAIAVAPAAAIRAGVAKVNATMPTGVPLAGYNYAPRASSSYPLPKETPFTTFMGPSVGHRDTTWAKALVLETDETSVCFVTFDVIGSDGTLAKLAYSMAKDLGFTVPFDNVIVSGSHSHSGPGALAPPFLWSIAPATDLLVPEIQREAASRLAEAMVKAQQALTEVKVGMGQGDIIGYTHNRRSDEPSGKIDPVTSVLRVDDAATGAPMATLWNFAIHGICLDAPNLLSSADIMGAVSDNIEAQGGGVAIFHNGDAGDINPVFSKACCSSHDGGSSELCGGAPMAELVMAIRANVSTTSNAALSAASQRIDFGQTKLNLTLARAGACPSNARTPIAGGLHPAAQRGQAEIDICALCKMLDCTLNIEFGPAWVATDPLFTAIRLVLDETQNGIFVTIPGEALVDLGWMIRNSTQQLGYQNTFLTGYSQDHMGYFAMPKQYDDGGYESLLTFWGIETAHKVWQSVVQVAQTVTPPDAVARATAFLQRQHETFLAQHH